MSRQPQSHQYTGFAAWALALPTPPPEQIRRQTEEVFARPEFAPGSREPSWLSRILEHVFRWLANLHATAPILYWVLLIACLTILLLLLAYVFYSLSRAFTYGSGGSGTSRQDRQRLRLSAELYAEAMRWAERGDFTEAIRHLFLALVHRFDEGGRVTLQKAATNHEYLALLDPRLPVRDELGVFVETLDDHWYGQRPADRPQFDRCLTLYQRLVAA